MIDENRTAAISLISRPDTFIGDGHNTYISYLVGIQTVVSFLKN